MPVGSWGFQMHEGTLRFSCRLMTCFSSFLHNLLMASSHPPDRSLLYDRYQPRVDFSKEKQRIHYIPLDNYGTIVEKVNSYRYLGVHISEDLTRTTHITTLVKKARQHFHHLRWLRKFKIYTSLQQSYTVESVLFRSITVWYGNFSSLNRKALHREIQYAEHVTRTVLPCLKDIYTRQCRSKANHINQDVHPNKQLSYWLPSCK